MSFKPVTVTQLSTYLKQIFDAEELLHNISVVGEISGMSYTRGTAYFTLKDDSSALSCVCFVADKYQDFKDGDSVVVVGSPRYYVKGGKLNFNVAHMEPYGESILYQRFLELKAKLESKGYFEQQHKLPMPKQIKRIGVVSSEGGAVIRDIINVRTRRNPGIDIVLYPVKVQGVGAEYEIAKGIEFFDNYNVDAIVVARGGGSMEDLQPFNTEVVADATYNCKKFIMSAVGHETDFTIIDFCSDMRAPTPSVASELLCFDLEYLKDKFLSSAQNLQKSYQVYIQNKHLQLIANASSLQKNYAYVEQDAKSLYNSLIVGLYKVAEGYYNNKKNQLEVNSLMLNKLNPAQVLKLGYACVRQNKSCVMSVKDVAVGDEVNVQLKDGVIYANVTKVR